MLVVAEVDDPYVPLPDDLLVNLQDSRHVVDALLASLPAQFAATTQVRLLPAPDTLQCLSNALHAVCLN